LLVVHVCTHGSQGLGLLFRGNDEQKKKQKRKKERMHKDTHTQIKAERLG
jgi:hypothetical protein